MPAKDQNLRMRITEDNKQLLVRAANKLHMNLTAFVLQSATEKAHETLQARQHITLTKRDMKKLLDILEDDEPNEALKEGAVFYNKVMGND
jgi:uncharacterized protein (DUF1778 family)